MAVKNMSFKAQAVSRNAGNGKTRSAVSMAAYRAGEKLYDERYREEKDFSGKRGIYASEIITPDGSPEWASNRQQLWNKVEAAEKRYDARVCREFIISLPNDISHDHKKEMIRHFVQENFTRKGLIADIAYHDFTGRHSHNPHCHIMITTRPLKGGKFDNKDRELDKKDALQHWRKSYMEIGNRHLERQGYEGRITTESLETRGITDRAPVSESMAVNQMRKKHRDKPDQFPLPEIAKQNDELKQLNKQLADLQQELVQAEEREKREQERQEKTTTRPPDKKPEPARATAKETPPANQNQPAKDKESELDEDTRQLIRQWQEYRERERIKPRRPDNREERGYDFDEYER
ncbi:MobA/MobL family protein [Brasilonema sp. CT11]|nr:MobA/MobL family protein [Brasilonema sp. CT11]